MTFDVEDKITVGRVLNVDGIISFHGESVAEFECSFHAAVDEYTTACIALCAFFNLANLLTYLCNEQPK